MTDRLPVRIEIIGMPVACMEGVGDPWRTRAAWLAEQLTARFGDAVRLEYHGFYDADCPPGQKGQPIRWCVSVT